MQDSILIAAAEELTHCHDVFVFPHNPEPIWMGIDSGLWKTLDGGDIWTRHNRGLPNRPVTMLYLPYEQYEILVATYGCGVYRVEAIKVDTGFSSRVSRGSEAIPTVVFMLHASYPNPFTDETLLAFSTPALA